MGMRAKDYFAMDGVRGHTNSIVDVRGVLVGHNKPPDNGPPLLSGVTAILPQGYNPKSPDPSKPPSIDSLVPAAWFTLNGNGEMTGTHMIEELGLLEGPIMLTNTLAVGTVRNEVIKYAIQQKPPAEADEFSLKLPVVAETDDSWLNDSLDPGTPVTEDVAKSAIDEAFKTTPTQPYEFPPQPAEGNVGGGTSNTCYSWKGGIGTSSRSNILLHIWDDEDENDQKWVCFPGQPTDPTDSSGKKKIGYTVGVLVQANQGTYWDLVIRGVPVGTIMTPPDSPDNLPPAGGPNPSPTDAPDDPCLKHSHSGARATTGPKSKKGKKSSIIVVIATDAPLLPSQLKRLARRASLGIARTGTITDNNSGEIFIAFSTANADAWNNEAIFAFSSLPDDCLDPIFEGVVNATEEAILNALVAAETTDPVTVGNETRVAWSIVDPNLPKPALTAVMAYYNRAAGSEPYH
jgi:D-aminopeptidase